MEYGLGRDDCALRLFNPKGLNPCFNGIWSRTGFLWMVVFEAIVLILVLMEYGLGPLIV